jgi:hypothetical protein
MDMNHNAFTPARRRLAGISLAVAGMLVAVGAMFGASPEPDFFAKVSIWGDLAVPFPALVALSVALVGASLRMAGR